MASPSAEREGKIAEPLSQFDLGVDCQPGEQWFDVGDADDEGDQILGAVGEVVGDPFLSYPALPGEPFQLLGCPTKPSRLRNS